MAEIVLVNLLLMAVKEYLGVGQRRPKHFSRTDAE